MGAARPTAPIVDHEALMSACTCPQSDCPLHIGLPCHCPTCVQHRNGDEIEQRTAIAIAALVNAETGLVALIAAQDAQLDHVKRTLGVDVPWDARDKVAHVLEQIRTGLRHLRPPPLDPLCRCGHRRSEHRRSGRHHDVCNGPLQRRTACFGDPDSVCFFFVPAPPFSVDTDGIVDDLIAVERMRHGLLHREWDPVLTGERPLEEAIAAARERGMPEAQIETAAALFAPLDETRIAELVHAYNQPKPPPLPEDA